ncbi:hypothetical protein GQ42DRAFT_152090 [Ramicandelaber brevisporus]|nr:hypothetical protein GQ42DRAFT_152090 [Ramicandelaber brevisporus]
MSSSVSTRLSEWRFYDRLARSTHRSNNTVPSRMVVWQALELSGNDPLNAATCIQNSVIPRLSDICFRPTEKDECFVQSPVLSSSSQYGVPLPMDEMVRFDEKRGVSIVRLAFALEERFTDDDILDRMRHRHLIGRMFDRAQHFFSTSVFGYLLGARPVLSSSDGRITRIWRGLIDGAILQCNTDVSGPQIVLESKSPDNQRHPVLRLLVEEGRRMFPMERLILFGSMILFLLYSSTYVRKLNLVRTRYGLAMSGVASLVASLLITSAVMNLLGSTLYLVPWEVVPFALFAVYLENMLAIARAVVSTPYDLPVRERIGRAMQWVGPGMVVSLLTHLFILSNGIVFGLRVVREFCAAASVAFIVDFVVQITFFVTLLSFDVRRLEMIDYEHQAIRQQRRQSTTETDTDAMYSDHHHHHRHHQHSGTQQQQASSEVTLHEYLVSVVPRSLGDIVSRMQISEHETLTEYLSRMTALVRRFFRKFRLLSTSTLIASVIIVAATYGPSRLPSSAMYLSITATGSQLGQPLFLEVAPPTILTLQQASTDSVVHVDYVRRVRPSEHMRRIVSMVTRSGIHPLAFLFKSASPIVDYIQRTWKLLLIGIQWLIAPLTWSRYLTDDGPSLKTPYQYMLLILELIGVVALQTTVIALLLKQLISLGRRLSNPASTTYSRLLTFTHLSYQVVCVVVWRWIVVHTPIKLYIISICGQHIHSAQAATEHELDDDEHRHRSNSTSSPSADSTSTQPKQQLASTASSVRGRVSNSLFQAVDKIQALARKTQNEERAVAGRTRFLDGLLDGPSSHSQPISLNRPLPAMSSTSTATTTTTTTATLTATPTTATPDITLPPPSPPSPSPPSTTVSNVPPPPMRQPRVMFSTVRQGSPSDVIGLGLLSSHSSEDGPRIVAVRQDARMEIVSSTDAIAAHILTLRRSRHSIISERPLTRTRSRTSLPGQQYNSSGGINQHGNSNSRSGSMIRTELSIHLSEMDSDLLRDSFTPRTSLDHISTTASLTDSDSDHVYMLASIVKTSPCGRYVACATDDGCVRIHDSLDESDSHIVIQPLSLAQRRGSTVSYSSSHQKRQYQQRQRQRQRRLAANGRAAANSAVTALYVGPVRRGMSSIDVVIVAYAGGLLRVYDIEQRADAIPEGLLPERPLAMLTNSEQLLDDTASSCKATMIHVSGQWIYCGTDDGSVVVFDSFETFEEQYLYAMLTLQPMTTASPSQSQPLLYQDSITAASRSRMGRVTALSTATVCDGQTIVAVGCSDGALNLYRHSANVNTDGYGIDTVLHPICQLRDSGANQQYHSTSVALHRPPALLQNTPASDVFEWPPKMAPSVDEQDSGYSFGSESSPDNSSATTQRDSDDGYLYGILGTRIGDIHLVPYSRPSGLPSVLVTVVTDEETVYIWKVDCDTNSAQLMNAIRQPGCVAFTVSPHIASINDKGRSMYMCGMRRRDPATKAALPGSVIRDIQSNNGGCDWEVWCVDLTQCIASAITNSSKPSKLAPSRSSRMLASDASSRKSTQQSASEPVSDVDVITLELRTPENMLGLKDMDAFAASGMTWVEWMTSCAKARARELRNRKKNRKRKAAAAAAAAAAATASTTATTAASSGKSPTKSSKTSPVGEGNSSTLSKSSSFSSLLRQRSSGSAKSAVPNGLSPLSKVPPQRPLDDSDDDDDESSEDGHNQNAFDSTAGFDTDFSTDDDGGFAIQHNDLAGASSIVRHLQFCASDAPFECDESGHLRKLSTPTKMQPSSAERCATWLAFACDSTVGIVTAFK